MPSASAKIEKVASVEAVDPVKQMVILMEKKVRNLEKRKLKLDNYKSDVQNGKELNEDQKIAVSKYDAVVELLEFAKELSKSCGGIIQEFARQQKKLAKKEQIEKQQQEIHRLHEVFSLKYLLERLECEDVSRDFLNGENGAIKLTSEELGHLSMLYKLIESSLPSEQGDIESHFHSLAEHLIFLLEGKNKEVVGTTYKNLKELLQNIKDCGYFTRNSTEEEEEEEEEDEGETAVVVESVSGLDDDVNAPDSVDMLGALGDPVELSPVNGEINTHVLTETDKIPEEQGVEETAEKVSDKPIVLQNSSYSVQNGPLQEVLSSEGSFNFLQESQIDLESPHMDPAVVAVHQMAPPPTVNFSSYSPPQPHQEEEISTPNVDPCEVSVQSVQQPMPVLPSAARSIAPLLTSVQHSTPHDFDPSHPIPTQTFTNQSYAVMQNMIMPSAYVPVTMHHGPIPPHIAPIAVMPGLPPAAANVTTTAAVPMHVTVAPVPVTTTVPTMTLAEESKLPMENFESQPPTMNGSSSGHETDGSQNEAAVDRGGNDSEGFTTPNNYRGGGGGFRGRGRGRAPYYRGRNNNYNGSRGGYQGHNNYYQNGNGFRRGNPRGGPRGPINSRGRGNAYRSQSSQQQHPQKQQ